MDKNFIPPELTMSLNHVLVEELADTIRDGRNNSKLDFNLSLMANKHIEIGRDSYWDIGDMQGLKQHFHLSAKLALLGSNYCSDDGPLFTWPDDCLYGVLSDSPAAIHACATMATPRFIEHRDKPTFYQFYTHMYQLAIREEYSQLETKMNLIKSSSIKGVREEITNSVKFYSLFLNGDKESLEQFVFEKAQKWQRKVNRNAETRTVITSHVMAADAMEYAKLCWLKGIEVEIDHPLVPMELLPIKPLDHYDDVYDFLSPDWVPPPQNVFEKITKWIKGWP